MLLGNESRVLISKKNIISALKVIFGTILKMECMAVTVERHHIASSILPYSSFFVIFEPGGGGQQSTQSTPWIRPTVTYLCSIKFRTGLIDDGSKRCSDRAAEYTVNNKTDKNPYDSKCLGVIRSWNFVTISGKIMVNNHNHVQH